MAEFGSFCRVVAMLSVVFSILLLTGCLTGPPEQQIVQGIDRVIEATTAGILADLVEVQNRTLAVYYFTVGTEVSGISDYLINGLTTSLATQGKGRIQVVSRQVLDRILSEASFQMSDLADKETQIRIGQQLGADLILTGFIDPVADYYKLNTQVVEVSTGVVVTGLILDFKLEKDFAEKIGKPDDGSEVITIEREVIEVSGTATVTTLFETFDSGAPEIQLSHSEGYWGDRVLDAFGSIELQEQGSIDDSACARFAFEGSFDSVDLTRGWEDSDLYFSATVDTAEVPRGFDGFSVSVMPEGFAVAAIVAMQERPERSLRFSRNLRFNDNEWKDWKIPFASLEADEPGDRLDPDLPVVLEIIVDFEENYHAFKMRSGTDVRCAVLIDNIGFFKKKGEEDPRVLESFNDEIERLPFYADLYGSSMYTDYSTSDLGVVKINRGVKGQDLTLSRAKGGQSGEYLSVKSRLELGEEIEAFRGEEQSITLCLTTFIPRSLRDYGSLSFYIRSDLLSEGTLELSHEASDSYYGYELGVSGFWTRVRIPFDHLLGERGSLQEVGQYPEMMKLSLYFDLPPQRLERAVTGNEGVLEFELAVDDFLLGE